MPNTSKLTFDPWPKIEYVNYNCIAVRFCSFHLLLKMNVPLEKKGCTTPANRDALAKLKGNLETFFSNSCSITGWKYIENDWKFYHKWNLLI